MNKQQLIEEFTLLGLRPGMHVMVHSSLSSFGHVEGGADTVLDALMELITPEGTLMLPTFNHNQCYDQGEIFDLRTTPTINGIIPETFRKREGVLRSINPTHPVAAWGKNARRYTENHHLVDAMGKGSPLGLLCEDGGYCLLLGVDYGRNTFHHYVETMEGAPCLSRRGEVYPMRDGEGNLISAHTWGWRNASCPINDSARYAPQMAAIHVQRRIGQAQVTLYPLREGYEIIARNLREGLDECPPCSRCPVRPRKCAYTVEGEA